MPDVTRPHNDPYALIGENWPAESESAYHTAKIVADDSSVTASTQAQSARDAEARMADEHGQTAGAVSGGYGSAERGLSEQSITYTTISAWMADAGGKVGGAKKHIASLASTGTSEIRDAITSEVTGTPVSPSSTELISQYRNDIASVASKLSTDLDAIGHSLSGDPGASRTPTYTSVPTTPTPEHRNPTAEVAAYNHGDQPEVEPHQLPPMPRATSTPSSTESPSAPSTPAPASPHSVNPTLSNLISGSGPSGTPSSTGTSSSKSPSNSASSGTPAGQHQPTEQHQAAKTPGLPRIPSIGLPNVPVAAAESIVTAVSSATASQLPTAAPATSAPSVPASTGFTPGVSGAPPVTPTPLSPIGGGLPTPPVVQPAAPAVQGTPASPPPGVQTPAPPSPPSARGPVVDAAWLQRTYGLSPSLDLPKPETTVLPALFITDLPEPEAHLHRMLATLRQQFEQADWSQPMAVATIKRGLESKLVYVTSDGLSIHPHGVLLPSGVFPLDEMRSAPSSHDLEGSLMVTDKLTRLIPRNWEIEEVLSTVSGGESSQSTEEFQALVGAGELLECAGVRGRDGVDVDEALRVFARAALGSGGCGELEAESARLRGARWVGVQPTGYLDVLGRWYLADAAESMSRGNWGEAVHSAGKYMSLNQSRSQAA